MPTDPSHKIKDSDAILDFEFNFERWLSASEEIVSYNVTATPGITIQSDTFQPDRVIAWLAGGTAGIPYEVTCEITTNQGRTDQRTMTIRVVNR